MNCQTELELMIAESRRITYQECKVKAMRKLLTEFCYDDLMMNDFEEMTRYVPSNKKDEIAGWLEQKRAGRNTRHKWAMFTLNFKEDAVLNIIKKKMSKIIKKIWIDKYWYCYETRGTDDQRHAKGIHVHILIEIKNGKYVYNCKRKIKNTIKHLIGENMRLCPRYADTPQGFKNLKSYICTKDKEHIDIDTQWRKTWAIERYYSNE